MRPIMMMLVAGALAACGEKDTPADDSGEPAVTVDADGDGSPASEDCDDADAAAHPGAPEVCDGVDNDCDGGIDLGAEDALTFYGDSDGDGYGDPGGAVLACEAGEGVVEQGGDCDDTRADVYPGAPEVCDGVDNGCDGLIDDGVGDTYYRDDDGDGYGLDEDTQRACEAPTGYVAQGGDCDDESALASPGNNVEVCDDGLDNDCDGSFGSCGIMGLVADSAVAALELSAGNQYGYGGYALANCGDSDGDGVDELLLSAPYDRPEEGIIWRVDLSGESGAVSADEVYDARYYARSSNQTGYPGYALAAGVDHDGDRVSDVLIGDPYASGQSSYGGVVYLLSGDWAGSVAYDRDYDHRLIGYESYGYFGSAVLLSEDLNGDGAPDLVASEKGYPDSRGVTLGRVQIFTALQNSTAYADDADISVVASTANSEGSFGEALAAADVDGDGVDDLAISAYGQRLGTSTYVGAVSLFLGPLSGSLSTDERDAGLRGVDGDDYFGFDLAMADVDQDGYADLFVAAPGRPGADSTAGEAALFLGPIGSDRQYSDADATLLGPTGSLYAAQALALPGDLDNDGDGELVVNDPYLGGGDHGAVHVLYWPVEGSVSMDRDATIQGTQSAALGASFAGGDFDGDGIQDLMVGATGDYSDDGVGGALLFLGGGY